MEYKAGYSADRADRIPVRHEASIAEAFDRCVEEGPQRLAIKIGESALTYEELDRRANRVAHAILRGHGPGAEPVLALFGSSLSLFTAMMGIYKAGKIYIPAEPSDPTHRLSLILENSRARLVLTDSANLSAALRLAGDGIDIVNLDELDADPAEESPNADVAPDAVACILYTSGSTGEAKGVIHTHRSVQHANMRFAKAVGLRPGDRVLRPTSLAFAGGFRSALTSLTNGAAIVTVPRERHDALPSVLIREQINICHMPPSVLRHFLDGVTPGEKFPDLRLIYVGGDGLTRADIERFREVLPSGCALVHSLALTEAGAVRQFTGLESAPIEGNIVPVGYAVEDVEVIILNEDRTPASPGETGEIAVRSCYLSRGYMARPDLTQRAFLPDPEGGDARIYLTADIGRLLPDGCLVYLGRKDSQWKIRGYRISGVEVKAALDRIDGIRQSFLLAQENRPGETRLVAYIVPEPRVDITVSSLRRSLRERLPEYMVPSAFIFMDKMPLTPNGKVDGRALPEPGPSRPCLENPYVGPSTPDELLLVDIWCEVLGLDQVGIHDNFFDLGGHSLLTTMVLSRLHKAFGVSIPLRIFFESPTVAGLDKLVKEGLRKEIQASGDPTQEGYEIGKI